MGYTESVYAEVFSSRQKMLEMGREQIAGSIRGIVRQRAGDGVILEYWEYI